MIDRPAVAMVTGSSRGFGLALSRALLAAGWKVVIDARDELALRAAADDLAALGEVTAIAGDVTDAGHRDDLIGTAKSLGGLDLLVNNASMLGPSPQPALSDYPLDVLRRVYEVNVIAPVALIQSAMPLLRESKGVIVNVTSDAAVEGYEGWGGYGSSKAALSQVSNVLAAEEPEVTVIWFDPGDMNTVMHQEAFPGEDISDRPPPEESVPALLEIIGARSPSGWYRARSAVGAP